VSRFFDVLDVVPLKLDHWSAFPGRVPCGVGVHKWGVWWAGETQRDALMVARECGRCEMVEWWDCCYGAGDGCAECEAVRGVS